MESANKKMKKMDVHIMSLNMSLKERREIMGVQTSSRLRSRINVGFYQLLWRWARKWCNMGANNCAIHQKCIPF
jgi:hypothetical protein